MLSHTRHGGQVSKEHPLSKRMMQTAERIGNEAANFERSLAATRETLAIPKVARGISEVLQGMRQHVTAMLLVDPGVLFSPGS